jgi:shikimate kinase
LEGSAANFSVHHSLVNAQVGKMLANTLKYAFFDTDTMVEMTHEKRPVSDIFKEYGEEYFRECEAEVLKQLAPYKNLVVATGGGCSHPQFKLELPALW